MGMFDWITGKSKTEAQAAITDSGTLYRALVDAGAISGEGGVTATLALRNTAVLRSVSLISGVMGRLPAVIKTHDASGKIIDAIDHPLYKIFMHRPNGWQDASQFKKLMELWVLLHGNAYALIVRGVGGRVVALNPIHPERVTVEQLNDFSLIYKVTQNGGANKVFNAPQILHLRGDSEDGITGLSPVKLASDVISARNQAARASQRIFTQGMLVGGNLKHPGKLSKEAHERLIASMEARHSGANNAGKWMVTEEGMEAVPFKQTAVDAQLVEFQASLVEDIGRIFGVPRPLLMVDDTSWGSGIEQLAILFARFTLAVRFVAWEEAVKVALIPEVEWGHTFLDFDERELLRGTTKEQFEAYALAAGAGGHTPWMESNEIRADIGLGAHDDGTGLSQAGQGAVAEKADSEATSASEIKSLMEGIQQGLSM